MTSYYISSGGEETKGPYALDQLRSMWNAGTITADTLAWDEEAQEWIPVSRLIPQQKTSGDIVQNPPPSASEIVCLQCGSTKIKERPNGTMLVEVLLWVFLFWTILIPLCYSLWRLTAKKVKYCGNCGSDRLIHSSLINAAKLGK